MERAGLDTIGCLEIDAEARSVLRANRPGWGVFDDGDVNAAEAWLTPDVLGLDPGELTLVAGGPPCQPFSKAAQWAPTARGGMRDDRAQGVHGMLQVIDAFLPRAVLIENVEGFLNGQDSAADVIVKGLNKINRVHGTRYRIETRVVDAADYGVPQRRRRAIAIAYRDGQTVGVPDATHTDRPLRAWDALWDLEAEDKPAATGQWAGLLASVPEGGNYQYLTARGEGEELFGWRTRYWSFLLKLAKDQPSWTLPASPGPSTGPFHWDNRPLSIREQMRLQSFPDDWVIDHPYRPARRMVGNATPPLLAEVLGRTIVRDLKLGDPTVREALLVPPPTLLRDRQQNVPPATTPVCVPAIYHRQIGEREAHPGEGRGPAPRVRVVS